MNFKKLLKDVFAFNNEIITILYDIPYLIKDNKDWIERRKIAENWYNELKKLNIDTKIASYASTNSNNADLPDICNFNSKKIKLTELMSSSDIIIALTEFSATAPLHCFAKKYKIRAASMPGFNKKMLPALELNFADIKEKVDDAYNFLQKENHKVNFEVADKKYSLHLDFRNRKPIKDDGDCTKKGTVINLPSGEAFIAPNDKPGSETNGILPIQIGKKINFYEVENNRIVSAKYEDDLIKRIREDPAVGNIAEFAIGVLSDFGIKPCGKILLDEKLGIHIALGRNDHFGGLISPDKFRKKENVWHQDYVYIKEMQPKIKIS